MAKLVEDQEMLDHLGESTDTNGVIASIRDAVEDLLEALTGRLFGPAAIVTNEHYDGAGSRVLYLKRPIALLTDIRIIYGNDEPHELEFDVNDMYFEVGKRRLQSRFYTFPCGMRNVVVSYETTADQPALAKQAVKDAVAVVWFRRGSEESRSESTGTYDRVMLRSLDESMAWKKAVDALSVAHL